MRHSAITLILLVAVPAWGGGPADAYAAAEADARKLTAEQALYARWFDTSTFPAKRAGDSFAAFVFHVNCLSRQAEFAPLVKVTPTLVRLDLRDIGLDNLAVWERLRDVEPYFHTQLVAQTDLTVKRAWPGDVEYKRDFYADQVKTGTKFAVTAPWIDAKNAESLIKLTYTEIPVVRADWFFSQTAACTDDRKASYYDFLGIKKEDDIAKLTGLDRAAARRIQRETAAIIARSGVALHNRQIYRFNAIAGGYWETLDVKESTGKKNAIRQLNGDFKPDAKEVYFSLPNRLWGLAAVNAANGELQASVPDFIAPDHESTSNDRRITASVSCIRCHTEGLRPIDDYARKFYSIDPAKGGALLTSPDYDKLKRLQRLYLGDLQSDYELDQAVYTRALARLLGPLWTPQKVAGAYARVWEQYVDSTVSIEQLALELGCTPEKMLAAFEAAVKAKAGNADPVLIGYIRKPPFLARREHIEESFGVMALAVKGYVTP